MRGRIWVTAGAAAAFVVLAGVPAAAAGPVLAGVPAAVAGPVLAGVPAAAADGIRDAQWHLGFLDIAAAHRSSQGAGVTVAVVDSGVDGTHPDLTGSLLPSVDATRVPEATSQSDVDGRGTGLAGLIAGHGHGASAGGGADGVLGIAPQARILPVVITTRPGQFGDPDVLADGIDLAVARGARVICVGRGMPSTPRLEQAVAAALRADVVIVAPTAGRAGEVLLPWPAAYPGVLSVAPIDRTGALAGESVTPPQLAAPGVDLVTTDTRGGYRIDAGAGAAAVAAGAAALLRSRYPQLAATAVVRRLTATSADRGPRGQDEEFGHGVLDVVAALTRDLPVAPLAPSASASPASGTGPAPVSTTGAVGAPPGGAADPAAQSGRPAFSSGDWRRWLVAVPLLGFFAGLGYFAWAFGLRAQRGGLAGGQPTDRSR